MVPFAALADERLTATDKVVLATIAGHDGPNTGCFARTATLMEEGAFSRNQFFASTRRLEDAGWIERITRPGRGSHYKVVWPADEGVPKSGTGSAVSRRTARVPKAGTGLRTKPVHTRHKKQYRHGPESGTPVVTDPPTNHFIVPRTRDLGTIVHDREAETTEELKRRRRERAELNEMGLAAGR